MQSSLSDRISYFISTRSDFLSQSPGVKFWPSPLTNVRSRTTRGADDLVLWEKQASNNYVVELEPRQVTTWTLNSIGGG